ncbi:MAG: hypothetical protein IJ454_05180 [Clostridia bacterium]|nr:hypothetical protein [Clostridia bacterium]
MEAIILKPFHCDITGVVEYLQIGTRLKLKYNVKRESEEDKSIYKLMALSSMRPDNKPVVADTLEFIGCHALGQRYIDETDAALSGYELRDIDTFVLAQKTDSGYRLAGAGFARLSWDAEKALSDFDKPRYDPALCRADELYRSYRGSEDREAYEDVLMEISRKKKLLRASQYVPVEGYEWFELTDCEPPINISSYRHILTSSVGEHATASGVPLLYGVGDDGMTAFAVRSRAEVFDNASDCSIQAGDFNVVGVLFTSEGQFFARLK